MMMLRIEKVSEDDATVTLKVEGRIVGHWVATLEEECFRSLRGSKQLILDLAGVSFIDRDGVALLMKVKGERVRVLNCSPFVKELLGWTHSSWAASTHPESKS